MKKTIVYVRNKYLRPSDYYRFIQYTRDLNCEISVRSAIPDWLNRISLSPNTNKPIRFILLILCYFCILFNFYKGCICDCFVNPNCIIVVREMFPRRILPVSFYLLKKKAKKYKFIWDFDDSIIGSEISIKEANVYYQYARRIVVSTPYLKKQLPDDVQKKADVLSTTDGSFVDIDTEEINKKRLLTYRDTVKLVWVATANNMPNLTEILGFLDKAAEMLTEEYGKKLELLVVCNAVAGSGFKHLSVNNIQWTRQVAIESILSSHIGIMPLKNNDFALGKAGFKLIQYMAAGLPVIASNIGYNVEIIDSSVGFAVDQKEARQWIDAVLELSSDAAVWEKYSAGAKNKWDREFSYQSHLEYWNKTLRFE